MQDDQVGVQRVAVVEHQTRVGQPDRPRARVDGGAEPLEVPGQDGTGRRADLAAEQVLSALHDLGDETADRQGAGDLEAEQPAADDHRVPGLRQCGDQPRAVVQAAERVHLRVQPTVHPHQAADRRQGGDAAGGEHETVVATVLPSTSVTSCPARSTSTTRVPRRSSIP